MSGGGEAAPAPAEKAVAATPVDLIEDLSRQIYIQLSANVHATPGEKPEHLKLVELSFRLAEAFQVGNLKFNTAAIAPAWGAAADVPKNESKKGTEVTDRKSVV